MHERDPLEHLAVDQAGRIIGGLLDALGSRDGDRSADGGGDGASLRADLTRSVDLVLDLVRHTFEAYADLADGARRRPGLSVTADAPDRDELVIEGPAGADAIEAPLFLHNLSGAAVGPVALRVTDLVAHDGGLVPSGRLTLDPPALDKVRDGASDRVTVRADVAGVAAGAYHGHVLTAGAALPVRLVVRAP